MLSVSFEPKKKPPIGLFHVSEYLLELATTKIKCVWFLLLHVWELVIKALKELVALQAIGPCGIHAKFFLKMATCSLPTRSCYIYLEDWLTNLLHC